MASPVPALPTDLVLSPHVTVLVGESAGKYPDGNSVIVAGSEGTALIDPSLTVHRRGGPPVVVDRVLISHAHEDHVAGLAAVGVPHVHAHFADLPGVRTLDGLMEVYGLPPGPDEAAWRERLRADFHVEGVPAATGFGDGDVFDLGDVTIQVLHLPGHTRGHCAFLVDPGGIAFVGDIDLSSFGPYYGDHWSDLDEFVASIAKVRDLDADAYVTFHHKGVVRGHDEFVRRLDEFAAVIGRRDEQLLQLLARPRSFAELVDEGIVYRKGSRPDLFGTSVEQRSIAMHLERLEREGMVQRVGELVMAI